MPACLTHHTIEANGIKLHYVDAGDGPLVVLLHGFPETWYAWRKQIPVLSQHYRLIATCAATARATSRRRATTSAPWPPTSAP